MTRIFKRPRQLLPQNYVEFPNNHYLEPGEDFGSTNISEEKIDYLYGRSNGTKIDSNNLPRTNQNALQMIRRGVPDNHAGLQLIADHFNEIVQSDTNIIRTFSDEFDYFEVRSSFFAGTFGQFANLNLHGRFKRMAVED